MVGAVRVHAAEVPGLPAANRAALVGVAAALASLLMAGRRASRHAPG